MVSRTTCPSTRATRTSRDLEPRPGTAWRPGRGSTSRGLLVLYVHLVYSFDLYKFFGKDAWVDAGTMTEIRTNVPWQAPPMGWRPEPSEPLRPPRSPEEARQIAEYV